MPGPDSINKYFKGALNNLKIPGGYWVWRLLL
jgi:hypothetical protein